MTLSISALKFIGIKTLLIKQAEVQVSGLFKEKFYSIQADLEKEILENIDFLKPYYAAIVTSSLTEIFIKIQNQKAYISPISLKLAVEGFLNTDKDLEDFIIKSLNKQKPKGFVFGFWVKNQQITSIHFSFGNSKDDMQDFTLYKFI